MKLELTLPTELSEIPLGNYQKFQEVCKNSNDEEFISLKMIEIFCGIKLSDAVKMKMTDVTDIVAHFNKLFQTKSEFKHRFFIGKVEFGFIPDLEEMSLGEYIDLNSNINDWETINKAMAVMFRPIIKTKGELYEIEEYVSTATYADVMKFAPFEIANAASVFFWNLGRELLEATLNYLEKKVKTNPKMLATFQKQLNLSNDGDGINQFIQSLKDNWNDSTQLQNYRYTNV